MMLIVPTAITETTMEAVINTGAGALLDSSVASTSYPVWVPHAEYARGEHVAHASGTPPTTTIYECIQRHKRRGIAPNLDSRHWVATTKPNTRSTWVSGASYALGDQVIRTTTRRVYEAVQSHAGRSTAPELDHDYWLDIGPTNDFAALDRSVGTRTMAPAPLTMTIAPGIVSALAILRCEGVTQVDIVMLDGTETVYSRTLTLGDRAHIADWWDYFFAEFDLLRDAVITDLPQYETGKIQITIRSGGSTCGVGAIVVGDLIDIAPSRYGARTGIIDFSRKQSDEYGHIDVQERSWSRRVDVDMLVPNHKVNDLIHRLAELRATPCVWVEAGVDALIVYGYYRDFDISIRYPRYSEMSLSIEGLT